MLARSLPATLCRVTSVGLIAVLCAGCGGSTGAARQASARKLERLAQRLRQAEHEHDGDGDNDSLGMGPLDGDKDGMPTYGRQATPVEHRAIAALLSSFYTAAAAGNATEVCSLLYPVAIEGLLEEHNHGKGPASLRGSNCVQIAGKLLRGKRQEMVTRRASLTVPIVEVRAKRAWAVLDFGTADEQITILHGEGSKWALTSLREVAF